MDLIYCLEPVYSSSFIPVVFVVITNSLSAFCIAGIAYTVWWRHRSLLGIVSLLLVVSCLSVGIKFLYGQKSAHLSILCCAAPLYVIKNYTFPSTHAAVVTVLLGQFLKPFFRKPETTIPPTLLQSSLGDQVYVIGKWEMVLRVFVMLIYTTLVYVSRLVLLTNDAYDVVGGLTLGAIILVSEFYFWKLIKPGISFVKTE